MAFSFRLQKILEYREKQKKLAQEELAVSQMELQAIQDELARLEREEEKLLQYQRKSQHRALEPLTLFSIENYRFFLQESYQNNLQALEEQEKKVEEKRHAVVECWRSCQVLEKLKENAAYKFFQEEKIREQHLNDEISLYGYFRKERQLF
ncbi:MAG: flagellar export protein FliJ [Firmicutes bacterium]|nr:flagellar export protein FliJ [Bacillota bacterium]